MNKQINRQAYSDMLIAIIAPIQEGRVIMRDPSSTGAVYD